MGMSVDMRRADDWAKDEDAKLLGTDPRLRHWVYVVDDEATVFMFRFAFMVKCPVDGHYVCVFSEHHPVRVFCLEELQGIWELETVQDAYGLEKLAREETKSRRKKK